MLPNELVLSVDPAHDSNPQDETYSKVKEDSSLGRSVYTGADHSLTMRETLTVSAREPIPSGQFRGVAKSSIKFTEDLTIPNALGDDIVAPQIGEISFSLPVGTTAAQAMHLRQRLVAALNSESFITTLTENCVV